MSVYVYLRKEVTDHGQFRRNGAIPTFLGIPVSMDGERPRLHYSSFGDRMPGELLEFVEEVSVRTELWGVGHRENGEYTYRSAVASIVREDPVHRVEEMTAKTLDDARELLRRFRIGDIWPSASYEKPQGGFSRGELEGEVSRLKREVERIQAVLAEATKPSWLARFFWRIS